VQVPVKPAVGLLPMLMWAVVPGATGVVLTALQRAKPVTGLIRVTCTPTGAPSLEPTCVCVVMCVTALCPLAMLQGVCKDCRACELPLQLFSGYGRQEES
jgi:hypothetical protein